MKSILGATIALCIGLAGGTDSHAQANYQLLCRGPLNYAVGTGQNTTVVFFQKNPTVAGNGGISLQQGKCAWTDRPVSAAEPTRIFLFPETAQTVRAAFVAFTDCAGDSRCVMEFMAHNANSAGNPNFRVDDGFIRIWYPAFP